MLNKSPMGIADDIVRHQQLPAPDMVLLYYGRVQPVTSAVVDYVILDEQYLAVAIVCDDREDALSIYVV